MNNNTNESQSNNTQNRRVNARVKDKAAKQPRQSNKVKAEKMADNIDMPNMPNNPADVYTNIAKLFNDRMGQFEDKLDKMEENILDRVEAAEEKLEGHDEDLDNL